MKRFGLLLTLLIAGVSCYAQTSAVSATVVDLDGTTWANGKWKIEFIPNPAQPNVNVYNINGTPLSQSVMFQNGVMDGSGNLAVTIYQNQVVSPAGSSWMISICPNAITQCGTYKFTANSSTLNLSSILTPIIPVPRFHPISGAYGYNDAEAILALQPGSTYWNVTGSTQRCYTGSLWGTCGSGGSSSIQLTGDVLAGPGASPQAAVVKGINSVPLCTGFVPGNGQAITYLTTSSPNPCYGAVSATAGVTGIIPGSNISCTTNVGGQCTGNVTIASSGGGNAVTVVPVANPSAIYSALGTYDPLSCYTKDIDARCYGAQINGTTDIGSAVQAAVNKLFTLNGGTGTVTVDCFRANNTNPGCYWATPSALTKPVTGNVKFIFKGNIQLGSSFVGYGWQNEFGDTSGNYGQFQTGSSPATFTGPGCTGTLGTAISGAGTQVTVTPTYSGSVYGGGPACTIANTPPGSAITIAGTTTSPATATRIYPSNVYGESQVTVTTTNPIRIPAGAIFTLSGCSNSTFNVTNQAAQGVDYTAQTITFFQTSTTPASATGCTITGFNEDSFESAHLQCVNGVPDSVDGFTCPSGNTVGSNKLTFAVNHAHSSSDQWGIVVGGPAINTYGPQTWDSLLFTNCTGMCFWADGSTNLVMNNVGAAAGGYITSGAIELSSSYLSQFHDLFGQISTFPQGGCGGGVYANCNQPSYPYALLLNAQAHGIDYNSYQAGCLSCEFDSGSTFVGGVKIDGDGVGAVTGFSSFTGSTMFEEVWGNAYTIDNRQPIQAGTALNLGDQYLQDNVSQLAQYLVGYTDGNIQPSGSVIVNNNQPIDTGNLVNSYFNGALSVLSTNGAPFQIPLNNTAPSGTYNEGHLIDSEIANEGAAFGPQIVPYGSLAMTSYSVASWSSLCATAGNCTITKAVGWDGPSGQMLAVDMATTGTGAQNADIVISSDTRTIYAGDMYLVWVHTKPGSGTNQNYVTGEVGGQFAYSPVYINSGLTFARTAQTGSSNNVCTPAGFGTQLSSTGWTAQVAVCKFLTGSGGSPTTITYHLTTANGSTSYAWDNFIEEPGWTFIPGPNNPTCTAAKTCNLTPDQIEITRRDQYHGCVSPNISPGTVSTCEPTSPVFTSKLNCLSVACAGGSTYTGGTTYTNNSGKVISEEVTMQYETYVAQGCEYELIALVNGLQVANNGVHNDCGGAATDSFTVQPSDTFSVTLTHVAGGTSPFTIIDWWENQ